MAKIKASDLLRMACVYAEEDRRSFLDSIKNTGDVELIRETEEFIKAVRKYRLKRWGKTEFEVVTERATPVPIQDIWKKKP